MKPVIINTIIPDGMYMDIHSIEFEINREKFNELIERGLKVIKENPFIASITVYMYNIDCIDAIRYFDSTVDDEEKTEETETRIDYELLTISGYGVYYRGYNKWSSDFLEVDLSEFKN